MKIKIFATLILLTNMAQAYDWSLREVRFGAPESSIKNSIIYLHFPPSCTGCQIYQQLRENSTLASEEINIDNYTAFATSRDGKKTHTKIKDSHQIATNNRDDTYFSIVLKPRKV